MRFTDHSRTSIDDTCPRARYWGYEYHNRGLSPVEPQEALTFGLAIAHGVAQLRTQDTVTIKTGTDAEVLQSAMLLAYQRVIWPVWLKDYALLGAEVEMGMPLTPDLYYQARPDAVLARLADQTIWVLSDKTTSLPPTVFVRAWDRAPQNHAECLAVERTWNCPVQGFITQGWYKGYQKDQTIYSPLCYGWRKALGGIMADQWSPIYRPGWSRARIDTFPGGVEAWVNHLPVALIQQQFPVTAPIMLRRDLADTYVAQVRTREAQIAAGGPDLFPQRFQHCDEFGRYRRACAFQRCCWVPMVGRDPIESGLYTVRMLHHRRELQELEGCT